MDKKYKLTNKSITWFGRTLFQIQAIKTFCDICKGDLGGYIEKEGNLSQEGNAWVDQGGMVYDNAFIYGNAIVCENAAVYGNAHVYDDAMVFGEAQVYGNAQIFGEAQVYGNAQVSFNGDYLVIGPFGENKRMITIGDNIVNAGFFSGTFDEFKNAVIKKYGSDYGSYAKAIQIIETLKF